MIGINIYIYESSTLDIHAVSLDAFTAVVYKYRSSKKCLTRQSSVCAGVCSGEQPLSLRLLFAS